MTSRVETRRFGPCIKKGEHSQIYFLTNPLFSSAVVKVVYLNNPNGSALPSKVEQNIRRQCQIFKFLSNLPAFKWNFSPTTVEQTGHVMLCDGKEGRPLVRDQVNKDLVSGKELVRPAVLYVQDYCDVSLLECVEAGPFCFKHDHRGENLVFSEDLARTYFIQIADALRTMHLFNIAHRNVKPANILFRNGWIKVVGLSNACVFEKQSGVCINTLPTSNSLEVTSERFKPPEIVSRGGLTADDGTKYSAPAVDVWSAGVTLFKMTTAVFPFGERANRLPGHADIRVTSEAMFCKYLVEACNLLGCTDVAIIQHKRALHNFGRELFLIESLRYQGATTDLRSDAKKQQLAGILTSMRRCLECITPPFYSARRRSRVELSLDDFLPYIWTHLGNWTRFWQYLHALRPYTRHLSADFKNLVQAMLDKTPQRRPRFDQILDGKTWPWVAGPRLSGPDAVAELNRRVGKLIVQRNNVFHVRRSHRGCGTEPSASDALLDGAKRCAVTRGSCSLLDAPLAKTAVRQKVPLFNVCDVDLSKLSSYFVLHDANPTKANETDAWIDRKKLFEAVCKDGRKGCLFEWFTPVPPHAAAPAKILGEDASEMVVSNTEPRYVDVFRYQPFATASPLYVRLRLLRIKPTRDDYSAETHTSATLLSNRLVLSLQRVFGPIEVFRDIFTRFVKELTDGETSHASADIAEDTGTKCGVEMESGGIGAAVAKLSLGD